MSTYSIIAQLGSRVIRALSHLVITKADILKYLFYLWSRCVLNILFLVVFCYERLKFVSIRVLEVLRCFMYNVYCRLHC